MRHTGIVVEDMDRSIDFYTGFFGFTVAVDQIEEGPHIDLFLGLENVKVRTVKLSLGRGAMLELLCFHSHPSVIKQSKSIYSCGITHIALTVEDLEKICFRLKSAGYDIISDPVKSPDGRVKLAFAKDPGGNFIEMVEEL